MRGIATFYTWFWIIYFPICLAFQSRVGFDSSDELLCVIMMMYGFFQWKHRVRNKARVKEMQTYWVIIGFYFLYSMVIHVTSTKGVLLDLLQQIRPYMVFYITWLMAPNFTKKQKKAIVFSMIVTMGLYFVMGANTSVVAGRVEDGGLPMVALTTGMSYYLFMKPTGRNKWMAIAIMLAGLLSGKSKYLGQCVTFIFIVLFLKQKLNYRSPKVYIGFALLTAMVIFFTWTKFNQYYVEGMEAEASEAAARPATYKTGGKIFVDYFPLGSGLGSFGTAAAAKEYSPLYYKYELSEIWGLSPDNPMFLADCFYPTLAEYGFVGLFLFLVFWKRRLKEIQTIRDKRHYQMALMAILALAIDSTANTAYLSGAGMGLFMTLAICLNSNRYLVDRKAIAAKMNKVTVSSQLTNTVENPT